MTGELLHERRGSRARRRLTATISPSSLHRGRRTAAQVLGTEEVGYQADVSARSPLSPSPSSPSLLSPALPSECKLTVPLPFPSPTNSWPSYLDNTVAGGISAGSTPYSTILREAIEEASLPPAFVASRIHGSSVLVYNYRTADGWLQPEVQYVYDLRMDAGEGAVRPGVNDGEVQEFMLMELDEVVERMVKGEFKPNCAIVSISVDLTRRRCLSPKEALADSPPGRTPGPPRLLPPTRLPHSRERQSVPRGGDEAEEDSGAAWPGLSEARAAERAGAARSRGRL